MKKLALVTGATSGIGKAYSTLLAQNSWDLIITGRRVNLIKAHGKFLETTYGIKVHVVIVDFNDDNTYKNFLNDYVIKYGDKIGFLINNIGFSNRDAFFDSAYEKNHEMINVHISKFAEITHYVVNGMKKNGGGNVVNVSSLVGFLPSLYDPFYAASKAFINTYSESIALILKRENIIVQSLCPGFTRTDFHKDMNLADSVVENRGLKRWMEPDKVVSYSYKKLKSGKVIVIPGVANKIVYNAVKLMPKKLYYILANTRKVL